MEIRQPGEEGRQRSGYPFAETFLIKETPRLIDRVKNVHHGGEGRLGPFKGYATGEIGMVRTFNGPESGKASMRCNCNSSLHSNMRYTVQFRAKHYGVSIRIACICRPSSQERTPATSCKLRGGAGSPVPRPHSAANGPAPICNSHIPHQIAPLIATTADGRRPTPHRGFCHVWSRCCGYCTVYRSRLCRYFERP